VTDTILAYTDTVLPGGREYLTDWQVEVNHTIKATGLGFNTDAMLVVPTNTSWCFLASNGMRATSTTSALCPGPYPVAVRGEMGLPPAAHSA
jgi:hypothetical protein